MKKRVCLICIVSFFILLFSLTAVVAGEKLSIVTGDQPPFYGKDMPTYGYVSETVKEAFKLSGYDVEFLFLPWARGLFNAKEGAVDGMFALWKRQDREQWAYFCNPFPIKEQLVFMKRKSTKILFNNIADLKAYRIGVVRGYSYPPEFANAGLKITEAVDDNENLKYLVRNMVDLVVVDKITGKFILSKKFTNEAKDIEIVGKPLQDEYNYLIISKKTKNAEAKVRAFNNGLNKLKASGKLNEIIRRHGLN